MNQTRRTLRSPAFDITARDLFSRFAIGYVNRVNDETFGLGLTDVRVDFDLVSHRAVVDIGNRSIVFSSASLENVPKRLRRYLVIHELAHFIHRDHDHEFWQAVEEFAPNYSSLERQLQICFERNLKDALLLRGEVLVDDASRGRQVRPRLLMRPGDGYCQALADSNIDEPQVSTCLVTESSCDIKVNTINGIAAPVSVV